MIRALDIHINARADIVQIRATDIKAAAAILAALEQVKADPALIDKLTTHGENHFGAHRLGVKRWESVRKMGNLWRFRLFDTPATEYRVIYGYHVQYRQICVLAVVRKEDFDYDDLNSDIARRILDDWGNL